jgi:hypothetical protein
VSQQWRYIPNHWHEITRNSASTARGLFLAGFGMDDRIINILAALCVAAVAAVTAWLVAHYLFGASVQTSASIGAAILAPLVAIGWFLQKSK